MKSNKHVAIVAAVFIALVLVAMAEVVIRFITYANPDTGILMIGRFAMMPYRPIEKIARVSWDRGEEVKPSTYIVHDPQLGWTIKPDGGAGQYTATSQGMRGPKGWRTTAAIPKGKIRICIYGDSFTHGDGVAFKDTWGDQLQRLRNDLQVLNFGVPAYGTDQALLRFRRDGRKFDAQFHLLGIWPGDMVRNLNVIRFYLNPNGNLGTSKPRFIFASGRLEEVNSPVMSEQAFFDTLLQRRVAPVERYDFWYRKNELQFPLYFHLQSVRAVLSVYNAYRRRQIRNSLYLNERGDAIRITVAIAKAFSNDVEALGSHAYVVIIPMRDFLTAHGTGHFPLVEALRNRAIHVIDLGPRFFARARQVGADALYLPDGHLSAAGNRLVAKGVYSELAGDFDGVRE